MMLPVSEIRVGVHRVQPFRPICKGDHIVMKIKLAFHVERPM